MWRHTEDRVVRSRHSGTVDHEGSYAIVTFGACAVPAVSSSPITVLSRHLAPLDAWRRRRGPVCLRCWSRCRTHARNGVCGIGSRRSCSCRCARWSPVRGHPHLQGHHHRRRDPVPARRPSRPDHPHPQTQKQAQGQRHTRDRLRDHLTDRRTSPTRRVGPLHPRPLARGSGRTAALLRRSPLRTGRAGFPRTTAQASSEGVAGCDTGLLRLRA
jgi:hypothetical protein